MLTKRDMQNAELKKLFSLVELLVVIAIIGILASLLMPVLKNAISMAKSTQCLSNLRQTGMVFVMYADSNNDYFPSPENPNSPSAWTPDLNWGKRLAVFNDPSALTAFTSGLSVNQTNALSIFRCPAHPYLSCGVPATSQTYGMNIYLTGSFSTRAPVKRSSIGKVVSLSIPYNEPHNTIIIADSLYAGNLASITNAVNMTQINRINSGDAAAVIRHKYRCNALFFDNSVRSVSMESLLGVMKWNRVSDISGTIYTK